MLTQLCPVTYANVKSNDSEMNNLSFTVSYQARRVGGFEGFERTP